MTYEEASARTVALIDEHLIGGGTDRRLIGELLREFRVRLVADEENASTLAGQEILLTTILLVRRMGMGVDLCAPEATLLASGPPFGGDTLHAALRSVEGELLPGTSFTIGAGGQAHVELLVGSSPSTGVVPLALRAGAEGFRADPVLDHRFHRRRREPDGSVLPPGEAATATGRSEGGAIASVLPAGDGRRRGDARLLVERVDE